MPAARPVETDVRSATLAAATRLFAARGFEGTALQDIANMVGVTKPAILHHYPSKERIRQAVLDSIVEHWNKILPRLLLAATTRDDRFEAVFGELHRFFASDPDRARLLMREALDRPEELRKVVRGAVRPWLSAIAQYVRTGSESGTHHADIDPEAYVLHMMQLVIAAEACAAATRAALSPNAGSRSTRREKVPACYLHAGRSSDEEIAERYGRELARIAKSSLFAATREPSRNAKRRRTR
jgi:AcrR family transcriptional regulator